MMTGVPRDAHCPLRLRVKRLNPVLTDVEKVRQQFAQEVQSQS